MTSFDTIGNIAIFSEEFKGIKNKTKELLKLKNIETVAVKTKFHSGTYRTRKIKILAGKKSKETVHKENNVRVKLNIETCYFSPRLSNERLRISKQIKKGEVVLVLGSGVGIFPLVFSKNSKAKEIYGIEINPKAHNYALANLKLNNVDNIKLFKGDVKKILPKIRKKFDRIAMPMPSNSEEFLDLIKNKLKPKGVVHLYTFDNKGINLERFKILKKVKCGSFGPGKFRICLDLKF